MSEDTGEQLGYSRAAAEKPAPTTIRTGRVGLSTEHVSIQTANGSFPAFAAWPERRPDAPVVIVISEAFGLHEHIADITRRFAHEGYFAVAPDLMVRQGDPQDFDDVDTLVKDLLLRIPDRQVMADLDATVEWAGAAGGDTSRLAVTGFCWGGRWTWLYAAHRSFAAAVAWYGIVDGSAMFPADERLFPRHPLDVAADLKAPVLGLYGGLDEAIPMKTIDAMRERLRAGSASARNSEIVVYPNAGHAFFADYRDSYRPEEAHDGWCRSLEWLADRLGKRHDCAEE